MSSSAAYREQYRQYMTEVEAAIPTDSMPEVPEELLARGAGAPLLATLLFNPYGPTIQTLSTLSSGDPEIADLVI